MNNNSLSTLPINKTTTTNTKQNTNTDGAKWFDRKAKANTLIAAAISHMRNQKNIDKRAYFITIHQEASFFSTYASSDEAVSLKKFQLSIYKTIRQFVCGNALPELQDQIGIIFGSDMVGTKNKHISDSDFALHETPHIHAVLILPFEIGDTEIEERLISLLTLELQKIYGVRRQPLTGGKVCNAGKSVLVQKYSDEKPLWYVVAYGIKASAFDNCTNDFDFYICPYQKKLGKYDPSLANTEMERQSFLKRRANICLSQEQTLRSLTYDPTPFYLSEVCRDISPNHMAYLVERKLLGTYGKKPTDREIDRIIRWGGRGSHIGATNHTTPEKGMLTWSKLTPSTLSYLDHAARSVVLGFDPEHPKCELGACDELLAFPSVFSWAKSFCEFHDRLGYWRLYYSMFRERRVLN